MTTAAERWREQLAAWAIPEAILASAPASPYGFSSELFRHRAGAATRRDETPSTHRALEALPQGGVVLDVGVGGGATSLPLAARAGKIVGVDGQPDMLEVFRAAATAAGVEALTILGRWPDVQEEAPLADVAVYGHVAYNTPDLADAARALQAHATRRVVVELTDGHPLLWMNDLWRRFHGVARPHGPTADDAVAVFRETGADPERDERTDRSDVTGGGFDRREDAIALVRRRLCLPAERDGEIVAALGDRLRRHDDLWAAGPPEHVVVTLWWDPPGDA